MDDLEKNRVIHEAMYPTCKVTGCIVDLDEEDIPQDTCDLKGDPDVDCIYAAKMPKSSEPCDCEYWQERTINVTDFHTPAGFFELFEFCKAQEWWPLFLCGLYYHDYKCDLAEAQMDCDHTLQTKYINPERFANEIYEFIKASPTYFEKKDTAGTSKA